MDKNWQTTLPTIKDRNRSMLNNKLFSDIEFSVLNSKGVPTTIPAHKYVLAIGSPVFAAMFYGDLAETSPTISLPDCTAEGLLELFRYMYYDEVELTGSVVMEIFYLAKKYIIPLLADQCTQYLNEELKPEDVFNVLSQVKKLDDEKLQDICWKLIDAETQACVTSDAFLCVTQDLLCDILNRDTLEIEELELFKAVNRWAENQGVDICVKNLAKRRALVDGVVQFVRFPLMTMDEFVRNVLPAKILVLDEVSEMFTFYNSKDTSVLNFFKAVERVGTRKKHEDSCKRFNLVAKPGWGYSFGKEDSITFSTDKQIYLDGIRLFGSQGNSYTVDVSIFSDTERIFQSKALYTTEEQSKDEYYGFTITLDKPVCVQPGIEYKIEVIMCGPKSFSGRDGKPTVQCKNVLFTFKEISSANCTSSKKGQFPELFFYY